MPGKEELEAGKPVVGETGANLEAALVHLHAAKPALSPSVYRHDYRITNAYPEPIAVALDYGRSKADNKEIREERNVQRMLREVEDCHLVVLGGGKAGLLGRVLGGSTRIVVRVPHVGNKGLNSTYRLPIDAARSTPTERRQLRVHLWDESVLRGTNGGVTPRPDGTHQGFEEAPKMRDVRASRP
jgi:hypothetical protein